MFELIIKGEIDFIKKEFRVLIQFNTFGFAFSKVISISLAKR